MQNMLIEKLVPGIVFVALGLIFSLGWKKIPSALVNYHLSFWKGIDRFSVLLSKVIVILLGVAFLLGGFWLIYQYIKAGNLY